MLIISAGMPKSGSTYMFHLLNGLSMAAGYPDSLVSRKKYPLDGTIGYPNNFAEKLPLRILARLWIIGLREGRFLVKTHGPLSTGAKFLTFCSAARVVYIYRDPRDCLLSALDYGAKVRERGSGPAYFAKMKTFEDAFREVKGWLATWRAYEGAAGVLSVKYEDLLANPDDVLNRCAKYLRLPIDAETRREVLWRYNPENPEAAKMRMPINKAVAYRYRTEMTPEHQQRFRDEFGEMILRMGFPLE